MIYFPRKRKKVHRHRAARSAFSFRFITIVPATLFVLFALFLASAAHCAVLELIPPLHRLTLPIAHSHATLITHGQSSDTGYAQMVKLTAENIQVKLGKRVNVATLTEAAVTNAQIDDVGSFAKFASLTTLDLSKNRFAYPRQLEGLKHAPALKSLVLAGCPLSMRSEYRKLVFDVLPNLELLDNIPVFFFFFSFTFFLSL